MVLPVTGTWPSRGGLSECLYDLDQCDRDLSLDSTRLFSPPEQGCVRCLDIGRESTALKNLQSLISHLNTPTDVRLRILMVQQTFSWGALEISEQMMRCVLRYMDASPAFARILHTFGNRRSQSSEASGIPALISSFDGDRVDRCFLLQCVELHGRSDQADPWSIRQFAVYERACQSANSSHFLLINHTASQSLRRRLKAIRNGTTEAPSNGASIHLILVSSATMQWSCYCNHLEEELNNLDTKASVDPTTNGATHLGTQTIIVFRDLQALQTAQDKLQHARSALRANLSVIESLSRDLFARGATFANSFDPSLASLGGLLHRVDGMLARTATLANHMNNIISFRSLDDSRINSGHTAEILQLAQDENKEIMEISISAREDTKTLKTITILTLVYLPASFVSETLLSMGYIKVDHHGGRASIVFEPEMLIFLVLTSILLLVTISIWLCVDRRRKRLARKRSDRLGNLDEGDKC